MQKTSHRNKLRLARRMMTQEEIKKRISPFQSAWWDKEAIKKANKSNNQKKLTN